MVKYKQHSSTFYASLLSQIKQLTDEASGDKHMEAFDRLKEVADVIENERVSIEEMCRYSGKQSYRHNKYLIDVFYLTLGECYDGDIYPHNENHELARQYYSMSNQSPAKWRLARLYKSKKIMPIKERDTDMLVSKLICEAIRILIDDDNYNQRYFGVRLGYLADMCEDLLSLEMKGKDNELYFDVLQWILHNKNNIRGEHQDTLLRFIDFDVECATNSNNMTLDEFYSLVQQ